MDFTTLIVLVAFLLFGATIATPFFVIHWLKMHFFGKKSDFVDEKKEDNDDKKSIYLLVVMAVAFVLIYILHEQDIVYHDIPWIRPIWDFLEIF